MPPSRAWSSSTPGAIASTASHLTSFWQQAPAIAARHGLIATAYDGTWGQHARLHHFALVYLFTASSEFYSCPLAMTDGAARCLIESGNRLLIDRAVPHFTSRDPAQFWTSGQWMTETTGGSDVGGTETVARPDEHGRWRLQRAQVVHLGRRPAMPP